MTPPRLEPVTLANAFVQLEPLAQDHCEDLRACGADPFLWRFASVNQHNADFNAWFDHRIAECARVGEVTFAVRDAVTGALVGSTSYLNPQLHHGRVEIGWTWYARASWAGPTNPACKRLLFTHAFETLGLTRVELKLDQRNDRSFAAIERLGARFEGVHRRHTRLPDGHIRDTVWFSVIEPEWPDVRAALDARLAHWRAQREPASA